MISPGNLMIFTFTIWWKNHGLPSSKIPPEKLNEKEVLRKIRAIKAPKKDKKRKKVGIKLSGLVLEAITNHRHHLWIIIHRNRKDFQQFITMRKREAREKWLMNRERKFFTRRRLKCWRILKLKTRRKTDTFCCRQLHKQWRTHLMWLVIQVGNPIQTNWLNSVSKLIPNFWPLSKITPT